MHFATLSLGAIATPAAPHETAPAGMTVSAIDAFAAVLSEASAEFEAEAPEDPDHEDAPLPQIPVPVGNMTPVNHWIPLHSAWGMPFDNAEAPVDFETRSTAPVTASSIDYEAHRPATLQAAPSPAAAVDLAAPQSSSDEVAAPDMRYMFEPVAPPVQDNEDPKWIEEPDPGVESQRQLAEAPVLHTSPAAEPLVVPRDAQSISTENPRAISQAVPQRPAGQIHVQTGPAPDLPVIKPAEPDGVSPDAGEVAFAGRITKQPGTPQTPEAESAHRAPAQAQTTAPPQIVQPAVKPEPVPARPEPPPHAVPARAEAEPAAVVADQKTPPPQSEPVEARVHRSEGERPATAQAAEPVPTQTARTAEVTVANATIPAASPDLQSAVRREATPPPAPAAPVVHEPPMPQNAAARPVETIRFTATAEGGQRAQIHLKQRNGAIEMAVRTPDTELAQSLRSGLPDLSRSLESHGFRPEMQAGAGIAAARDVLATPETNLTERSLWNGSDDDRSGGRRNRNEWNEEERERRPRPQHNERNEDD